MKPSIRMTRLPPDRDTGWKRWQLTWNGAPVGEVFEHREWRGWRYGGRRWIAVLNPSGASFAALWTSGPQRTIRAAVGLLADHLSAVAPR
jgi:hypothetical protein